MREKGSRLADPAPEAEWEVWYQDTFPLQGLAGSSSRFASKSLVDAASAS